MTKFEKLMNATRKAIRIKDHEFSLDVTRGQDGKWTARQYDDGHWPTSLYGDANVPPEVAALMERAFQAGAKAVRDEIKEALDIGKSPK